MFGGEAVFFLVGEVFEHEGDVGQFAQFGQKHGVIEASQAGADFVEMGCELVLEKDVFGVTTLDIGAELFETFTDELARVEISLGAGDDVYGVKMDGKAFSVYGF